MQGRRRPQPSGTNRATAPARKGRAPRARRRPRRDRLASPCGPQGAPALAPASSIGGLGGGGTPGPMPNPEVKPATRRWYCGGSPVGEQVAADRRGRRGRRASQGGRRVRGGPLFSFADLFLRIRHAGNDVAASPTSHSFSTSYFVIHIMSLDPGFRRPRPVIRILASAHLRPNALPRIMRRAVGLWCQMALDGDRCHGATNPSHPSM